MSIFGIHGSMQWAYIGYDSRKEITELFKRGGFKHLRLPGGTSSNYYWPETGTFGVNVNATGYDQKLLSEIHNWNMATVWRRPYKIKHILKFLKKTRTPFSWSFNPTGGAWATYQTAKLFKDKGVELTHAEFGNEVYTPRLVKDYPDVGGIEKYLVRAKFSHDTMKKLFPNVQMGLCVSPNAFQEVMHHNDRYKTWDEGIKTADWHDAHIIHLYPSFPQRDGYTLEEIFQMGVEHFNTHFSNVIAQWGHKDIWITEYAIIFWGINAQYRDVFKKSQFNAVFVANCLITYLKHPQVKLADFHNWLSIIGSPTERVFKDLSSLKGGIKPLPLPKGLNGVKVGGATVIVNITDSVIDGIAPYSWSVLPAN